MFLMGVLKTDKKPSLKSVWIGFFGYGLKI